MNTTLPEYLPRIGDELTVSRKDSLRSMQNYTCTIISHDLKPGARGFPIIAEMQDGEEKRKVVIKIPNINENYAGSDIDKRLGEFNEDIRRELDAWGRLKNSEARNNVAEIFGSGSYQCYINEIAYPIQFLVQEFVEGDPLRIWCEKKYGTPFSGIQDVKEWFEISRKLLELSLIHI